MRELGDDAASVKQLPVSNHLSPALAAFRPPLLQCSVDESFDPIARAIYCGVRILVRLLDDDWGAPRDESLDAAALVRAAFRSVDVLQPNRDARDSAGVLRQLGPDVIKRVPTQGGRDREASGAHFELEPPRRLSTNRILGDGSRPHVRAPPRQIS
jgi:hypothetical protein